MFIGIDIRGTNIRIASSKSVIEPSIIERIDFPNNPDYQENIRLVTQTIQKLAPDVKGIGIGMPGRLNATLTTSTHSPVKQWLNQPFTETLTETFHCPVRMNGDAYCAALSEAVWDKSHSNFFGLTYGTGIGVARVTYADGEPTIKKFSDEEHATYLHPWQKDCGGKWVSEKLDKPMADLSEKEWSVVMDRFYDHLVAFITALDPPRLVISGGVAVK